MSTSRPAGPSIIVRLQSSFATERRREWLALAFLIAMPIAIYLPLSLLGHPVMPGDDLNQNFPLRVLAGELLRSGRLPAWDPLIWSGTPLLAGWNAGAMFPGTWLFAFIPAIAAWTINLIAVPAIASTGLYVLARQVGCARLPAVLGALVFSYTGFMNGQVVHLGLTEGMAFAPWMLVAIEGITRARTGHQRVAHGLLLAAATGLCILAADPRAISNAAIVALVYVLACCVRARRDALRLLAWSLAMTILGIALAAVQWVPGLSFLHASQRSSSAYSFFGAGSITAGHLVSLLTVPYLLGGNGNFHLPVYQGNYNLPEVTVGAGLIALVATSYFLPDVIACSLTWLGVHRPRRLLAALRQRPETLRLGVWYVLGIVGTILTLGSTTRFGHLLVHLPFFGGERLQNRNAALFDLALSMLVALFIDDVGGWHPRSARTEVALAEPPPPPPEVLQRSSRNVEHLRSALMLVPLLIAIGLVLTAFVAPETLEHDLDVPYPSPGLFVAFRGYLIATIVLSCVIGAYVLCRNRLSFVLRRAVLVVLALCDIAGYVAQGNYTSTPTSVIGTPNPYTSAIQAITGPNGRYALYNPAQLLNDTPDNTLVQAGVTDLNVLAHDASVQGYGSIVNGIYQEATNTHSFENLNLSRLSAISFDTLDLRALFSFPNYFGETLAPGQAVPLSAGELLGADGLPQVTQSPLALPPDAIATQPASRSLKATYTLARPEHVGRVEIHVMPKPAPQPSTITIEAIGPSGPVSNQTVTVHNHGALVTLNGANISSLLISAGSTRAAQINAVVVLDAHSGARTLLDGALQGSLVYPHWRYARSVGRLVAFTNSETAGFAWLQPGGDKTPDTAHLTTGSVKLESSPTEAQKMLVNSPGDAVLARSEGFSPGWSAQLAPVGGGKEKTLPVHRFGLIQAINMPQGKYVVTWTYAPTSLLAGSIVTFLAFAVLTSVSFFLGLSARRRARRMHI